MSQTISINDSRSSEIIFDKRLGTNLIAFSLVLFGLWISEPWSNIFLNVGLFALSGALTNWLAVYMLFERVPCIYGSGVVPLHFEDFKTGIHQLIMRQFFDRENLENFFKVEDSSKHLLEFKKVFEQINLNPAFDSLLEVIQNSSFGPFLSMAGGIKALESLRGPFTEKLHMFVEKISVSEQFQKILIKKQLEFTSSQELQKKIEGIVTDRLDELTPVMVKEIIESMIQKHLSWLVVWGGFFGGLIGLIKSLVI